MAKPIVVFVLGGPGAGKGTQCQKIVDEFGYVHLSAGDLLREERKEGGPQGELIDSFIKEGKIIPVKITVGLIKVAMEKAGKDGKSQFLIDGFPRNEDNLEGWNEVMDGVCDVRFVLFLDCPEQVMEKRLLSRGEGRADDNIESIKKRFRTYIESTMPIVEKFDKLGKTKKIDSTKSPEEVYKQVKALFQGIYGKNSNKRQKVSYTVSGTDIALIQNTLNQVMLAMDTGDDYTFANCYTDDGTCHIAIADTTSEGRAELGALCTSLHQLFKTCRHWEGNVTITPSHTKHIVHNTSYWKALDGGEVVSTGIHKDTLVFEEGRWLIQDRIIQHTWTKAKGHL